MQTIASYKAVYGLVIQLALYSPQFVPKNFRILQKLQSTLQGQMFEDNEKFQKNMTSALKECHEYSKQWQYR
jgi:hypothetical protein